MDAIRIGCEFESILDVPGFDMIVPDGTSMDGVRKLYSPDSFKREIMASEAILERAKAGEKIEENLIDEATLDLEYLKKENPNARKFASLLEVVKETKTYRQYEEKIINPNTDETERKISRDAQQSFVRNLVDQIAIPGHDKTSYTKRTEALVATIQAVDDLDAEYENRKDQWTDAEEKDFYARYTVADEKKQPSVRLLEYMVKYESIIVAAWLRKKWTAHKKSYVIGMIDEFSGLEKRAGFGSWAITKDDAIEVENSLRAACFAIEFVGPIMEIEKYNFESQRRVVGIIGDFFGFLETIGCKTKLTTISTSTHIHFSPRTTEWTTEQARKVLCAAYFWDPCMRYLIPYWRRVRKFCPDMRAYPICAAHFRFPETALQEEGFPDGRYPRAIWEPKEKKLGMFLKCTREDVVGNMQDIMNKADKVALSEMFGIGRGGRNVGWNTTNLKKNDTDREAKDTIEWRRGPASLSAADALCWIELIFAFALAAVEKGTPTELAGIQEPSMDAFQKWLQDSRLDKSLNISLVLDRKFEELKKNTEPLYLCLTPDQEELLKKARAEYKKAPPPPKTFRVAAPTAEQTPEYTDTFMTEVADKSLAYNPTELRDQRLKEIIANIRASILSSMSKDLSL